jgi:hypothetical protein
LRPSITWPVWFPLQPATRSSPGMTRPDLYVPGSVIPPSRKYKRCWQPLGTQACMGTPSVLVELYTSWLKGSLPKLLGFLDNGNLWCMRPTSTLLSRSYLGTWAGVLLFQDERHLNAVGWSGFGCRGWAPDSAVGRAAPYAPRPARAAPGSTQPLQTCAYCPSFPSVSFSFCSATQKIRLE